MLKKLKSRKFLICFVVATIYALGIFAISRTDTGRSLEFKLATETEFHSKRELKNTSVLSKKIKIFAFSDKDLASLKRPTLSTKEWAIMLTKISAKQPRVIFIDKIFSFLGENEKENSEAVASMEKITTPIIVGSFLSKHKILSRNVIPLNTDKFSVPSGPLNARNKVLRPSAEMRRFPNGYLYGPHERYRKAFTNIGTLNYNGRLTFSPFIFFKDSNIISHAAILTTELISQRGGQIYLDQSPIPIDRHGDTLINLIDPHHFYKNIHHFSEALWNPHQVKKGDTVVLLPEMYTGGTDFHQSPYGYVPGGLFVASIINSVIQNSWINSLGYDLLFILVSCSVGLAIALLLSPFFFWITWLVFTITIGGLGQISFTYHETSIPWFWSLTGFVSLSIAAFAYKAFYWEKMALMLNLVKEQKTQLAEKAESLAIKTKDLSSLMANIKEGIFTITKNQEIHHEYSKHLEEIFEIRDITKMNPINLLFSYSDISRQRIQKNLTALKNIIGFPEDVFVKEEVNLVKEILRQKPYTAVKFLEINWQPINDSEGVVDKILVIVKDMTSLKQTQNQLAEIVKWQALIDMANGVAHEINNPLAIIDGTNSQIKHFAKLEKVDASRIILLSEKIDKSIARIATIVKKMKSFTLTGLISDLRPYLVTELFEELVNFCGSRLENTQIALTVNIDDPELKVECIQSTFIEAMLALINNSIDALQTVNSKQLEITAKAEVNTVVITIVDNGIGVPEQMQSTLFNPFVTGKPVGSGAGLGLFNARNILESFSGQISLLFHREFTTFEIRLPKITR